MDTAKYWACPFCNCDYNTGLILPKILPWNHTVCLSWLTRADLLQMDFECPICLKIFNIGDPTDLEVDTETIHVIRLIKERESLKKYKQRPIYSHENQNQYTSYNPDIHNSYNANYRAWKYRDSKRLDMIQRISDASDRMDVDDERRLTRSSNKENMEVDPKRETVFIRRLTDTQTPAVKNSFTPFTPNVKKAATVFPTSLKKPMMEQVPQTKNQCWKPGCTRDVMKETPDFLKAKENNPFSKQYYSKECKNDNEQQSTSFQPQKSSNPFLIHQNK